MDSKENTDCLQETPCVESLMEAKNILYAYLNLPCSKNYFFDNERRELDKKTRLFLFGDNGSGST